mmetsp:Transcript_32955/g.79441  ORF Transcript_32955/g.79441 Transcript_32955/m.79441 type:complete len:233 (-) Transcript_32955:24-722(-)
MHTPSQLGDHTKGPLGASKQLRQIISRGRLPHQSLGFHQVPVRQHHLQGDQVLTRCSVLQGRQARSAGCSHPSHRRVRRWIRAKQQAMLLEHVVHLHLEPTRPAHKHQVILPQLHLPQLHHVQHHPSSYWQGSSLEPGARAPGHHWDLLRETQPHHSLHFGDGLRAHHALRHERTPTRPVDGSLLHLFPLVVDLLTDHLQLTDHGLIADTIRHGGGDVASDGLQKRKENAES